MKTIKLSKGQIALVDDEDFEKLNQYNWFAIKGKSDVTYYAARHSSRKSGKRKTILMHREILGITDSKKFIDHKDHNGLNCQKSNMRTCSSQENQYNRTGYGSSDYLGVTWDKCNNKWKASISINGKQKHIGRFSNEKEAAIARDEAAKKHHGEFANLNFK